MTDDTIKVVYRGSKLCPPLAVATDKTNMPGWVMVQHPDGQWVTLFEQPLAAALKEAQIERDRLREVIEGAPHERDCRATAAPDAAWRTKPADCNCWKSKALAGGEETDE